MDIYRGGYGMIIFARSGNVTFVSDFSLLKFWIFFCYANVLACSRLCSGSLQQQFVAIYRAPSMLSQAHLQKKHLLLTPLYLATSNTFYFSLKYQRQMLRDRESVTEFPLLIATQFSLQRQFFPPMQVHQFSKPTSSHPNCPNVPLCIRWHIHAEIFPIE